MALFAIATPVKAQASPVAIKSTVFVERDEGSIRGVEPASAFRKGERVVTIMRWEAPQGSYTVVTPVPRSLEFERASRDSLQVSIDGGRSWRSPSAVQPEAVTHLRWQVGKGAGQMSYSAIVR